MSGADYTWDPTKAAANRRRHGVTFDEARSVFEDATALTLPDELHSEEEDRELTTGRSARGRVLFVAHTARAVLPVRIISARKATPRERRGYGDEEGD